VLHDDTFALLCPWIALLIRGVDQWVCLFMLFDVLPHPVELKQIKRKINNEILKAKSY
jgi:hypothetical protein